MNNAPTTGVTVAVSDNQREGRRIRATELRMWLFPQHNADRVRVTRYWPMSTCMPVLYGQPAMGFAGGTQLLVHCPGLGNGSALPAPRTSHPFDVQVLASSSPLHVSFAVSGRPTDPSSAGRRQRPEYTLLPLGAYVGRVTEGTPSPVARRHTSHTPRTHR